MRFALTACLCAVALLALLPAADARIRRRHKAAAPAAMPAPLKAMHKHACGLHRTAENNHQQVIVHHFCSKLPSGLMQCALFDTPDANARLLGVEYIVSAEQFKALSEDEQRLWHSHVFEVQSGMLAPLPLAGVRNSDVPIGEQRAVLQELMGTFGKTIHTWNFDALNTTTPTGAPQLMVSFTGPDQANPKIMAELDARVGNRHWERSAWRLSGPNAIPLPTAPDFAALMNRSDVWQTGETPQFQVTRMRVPGARDAPIREEAVSSLVREPKAGAIVALKPVQ